MWSNAKPHHSSHSYILGTVYRHFGTSAKPSVDISTGAKVSRHIGTNVLQISTGDSVIHTVVFPSQKCPRDRHS